MQLAPLALFIALLFLDQLLLFLSALLGNLNELFPVKLLFFEIHLILLNLLRSRNQLLLVLLLFVLLDYELRSETLLPHANLINLLLIIFGQKNGL